MTETLINSKQDYTELYGQYNWFKSKYPDVVQRSSDEFFLEGLKFVLVGISKNINTLMDKDSYFVTKIRIDKQHDMFFRTSEKGIGIILDKALGRLGKRFNLNKMTDLEAKIITSFNDYMFKAILPFFASAPPVLKRSNFDVIHLNFVMKDINENTTAKFIITLPQEILAPEAVVASEDKFDYTDFSTSTLDVSIKIGTTKFSLYELKHLDTDDIVVFDNSNLKLLRLKYKDYEKDINLNPNMGIVLPFNNHGGNIMGENSENTNLWDSIEVEMDAQFDSVKITLGDLKKIEEGIVVDLTSIYENKVTLTVEDKPIARGELVIVNDRYGVKIDKVLTMDKENTNSDKEENQTDNSTLSETELNQISDVNVSDTETAQGGTADEEAPAQEGTEEDEFDYSDFELEDEDI